MPTKPKKTILLKTKGAVSCARISETGLLAAVDWKGALHLARDGEPLTVEAHADRAQGVAHLPDERIATCAWDQRVCLYDGAGTRLDEATVTGDSRGFQRLWSLASWEAHIAVDMQDGADARLLLGTVANGKLSLEGAPAHGAKTQGHFPQRILSVDEHGVVWREKSAVVRVSWQGEVSPLADVPGDAKLVGASPSGEAIFLREATLHLPGGPVALPGTNWTGIHVLDDRIALCRTDGVVQVLGPDGSELNQVKHGQCAGVRWLTDGSLLTYGWDKRVRRWTGLL